MQKLSLRTLLISSAVALTCTIENTHAFEGVYSGASIGSSFSNGHEKNTFSQFSAPINANGFMVNSQHGLKNNSALVNLFLGYGILYEQFYLGTELFASWSKFNDNTSVAAMNTRTSIFTSESEINVKPFKYGIDLRPGITFNDDTLLFARLGLGYSKVTLSSSVTDNFTTGGGNNTPEVITVIPAANQLHTNRTAFRIGLGLEQKLTDQISLRVDYVHQKHRRMQLVNSTTRTVGTTTVTIRSVSEVKLDNNAVMLGLAYYW